RLILNYKRIPYKTHFLEIPDIAAHHTALGIPPNAPGSSALLTTPYTVPMICIPAANNPDTTSPNPQASTNPTSPSPSTKSQDRYIMDSALIAHSLETLYPSPPLKLDTPQQHTIQTLWPRIMRIIGPAILPSIPSFLTPSTRDYFIPTREAAFGIKLSDYSHPAAKERAWKEVEPLLVELAAVLHGREGPFVLGPEVSYADFVLVSMMVFLERCCEGSVRRFEEVDEGFGSLWRACEGWMERDD
ncbi:MAG: hypothetical protein Q9192_008150, partial [Flavoplaca navasiana]